MGQQIVIFGKAKEQHRCGNKHNAEREQVLELVLLQREMSVDTQPQLNILGGYVDILYTYLESVQFFFHKALVISLLQAVSENGSCHLHHGICLHPAGSKFQLSSLKHQAFLFFF